MGPRFCQLRTASSTAWLSTPRPPRQLVTALLQQRNRHAQAANGPIVAAALTGADGLCAQCPIALETICAVVTVTSPVVRLSGYATGKIGKTLIERRFDMQG